MLDRSPLGVPTDAGPVTSDAPIWPRIHPMGTLLIDHLDELWMSMPNGSRLRVSGDDSLGEIGVDEHSAISMTAEEERCLSPSDDYWGPPNLGWWAVYSPLEDDEGPYVVDLFTHTRHKTTIEALKSYGYFTSFMDNFTPYDDWQLFREAEPIGIRDGALVRTELGLYYIAHNHAFYFSPSQLASDVGYDPGLALVMSENRLQELAPCTFMFTRETFDLCPADEGISL